MIFGGSFEYRHSVTIVNNLGDHFISPFSRAFRFLFAGNAIANRSLLIIMIQRKKNGYNVIRLSQNLESRRFLDR